MEANLFLAIYLQPDLIIRVILYVDSILRSEIKIEIESKKFLLNRDNLDAELKAETKAQLQSLKQEYEKYFPDLANTDLPEWKQARNLFHVEVGFLPDKIQEELSKLKCNYVAKDDFKMMLLNDSWDKYVRVDENIGKVAMRILLPYLATYMCESGFSALSSMKTKARNKLDCEADMRCALSSTKPRIKLLVSKKQLYPSH